MSDETEARLARIKARAQAALDEGGTFDHRVAFDFGADGALSVDGPQGRATLGLEPADALVQLSLDDFVAVAKGERDPAILFLRKRIRVEGDFAAALALVKRLKA